MSNKAYFGQVEQNVNSMIADKKYHEAFKSCQSLLDKYPNQKTLLKLKKRIIKEVNKENDKVVKIELKRIKPLWKEESYAEILKTLKPLLEVAPNHEKLKKQIIKAQDLYKEQISSMQNSFLKEQTEKLTKILNTNPSELVNALLVLEKNNPGNKIAHDLSKEFRTKLIRRKIDQKEDLIYSDKFDAINSLISQLKRIDKKNSVIQQLEQLTKQRQYGNQVSEKNEFIYRGKSYLITLMQLKKYDKVIKAATEILEIDREDKDVQKILEKAESKYYNQSRNIAIEIKKEADKETQKEFKEDKSKFIKV